MLRTTTTPTWYFTFPFEVIGIRSSMFSVTSHSKFALSIEGGYTTNDSSSKKGCQAGGRSWALQHKDLIFLLTWTYPSFISWSLFVLIVVKPEFKHRSLPAHLKRYWLAPTNACLILYIFYRSFGVSVISAICQRKCRQNPFTQNKQTYRQKLVLSIRTVCKHLVNYCYFDGTKYT